MIQTVSDLVEAFGGTKAFAQVVGITPPSISRARSLNHIPYKWRPRLVGELQQRNINVSPELMGFEVTQ